MGNEVELTSDDDVFVFCNGSISTARLSGDSIHFNIWDEGYTNSEPRKFVITPEVAPVHVLDYQINGNVSFVQYEAQDRHFHCDLWYLTEPEGYLISGYLPYSKHQPHCHSFLTKEESELTEVGHCILDTNSNSKYLVKLCTDKWPNNELVKFVVVFDGYTFKNGHRIQMPENVLFNGINMTIVGAGKDAKTVLTALTNAPFKFFAFDMSNGETLLEILLYREHTSSDQYLIPHSWLTPWLTEADHVLGGVDVIRIEYNGENLTTSDFFASYGHVEEYDRIRLVQVTETQTLWEVDCVNGSYSIVCDYLLTDLDTDRFNYNNDNILSDTDSDTDTDTNY